MTTPHAIFGGLTLIALSIYFSIGSIPANAFGGIDKVQICGKFAVTQVGQKFEQTGEIHCARVTPTGLLMTWPPNP